MLEQGIHRHDEESGKSADKDEERIGEPDGMHHRHDHDDDTHGCAELHDLEGIFKFDESGCRDGANSDTDSDDPLQKSSLVQWQARACCAHFRTMNWRVAPAPQKRVVTASEICPSLSCQRVVKL